MIDRYSRECMRAIWSEHNKYATWLAIEIKACEALCELGTVPPEALADIKKKAAFDVTRIAEIEVLLMQHLERWEALEARRRDR